MNKKTQNKEIHAKTYHPPAWLTDALRASHDATHFHSFKVDPEQISAAFRHRCREAVDVALTLAKLRKERQRIGFVPLPFANYVQGLARVVGTSLSPVLAWLGIADLSRPDPDSARAFARLAQEIGFSLREALVYLRIGFISRFESAPISVLVAHRRSGSARRSQIEECEVVLGQLESECDPKALGELRHIESEIRAVYETHENAPI